MQEINFYMLQICKLSHEPSNTVADSSVVESNHTNALRPIARYCIIVPRACQISRSSTQKAKKRD